MERVEELFGDLDENLWITGDSTSLIKYNGVFVFESLISNSLGKKVIAQTLSDSTRQTAIAWSALRQLRIF
ncbi:MAG TPA: hypothetical protein VGC17_06460 [Lactovum miscens]